MALAPLTPAPHVVPANRLAFTTPVREAGGAGHWITIGGGDDDEGAEHGHGGVHIFITGGSGPGSGRISKGPKGLLGEHIAAIAGHPSAGKVTHHPAGHEPPDARDHPHYAEAEPKPPAAKAESGAGEPAKRAGKPYARLHGAEQGTRAEHIGRALSEARGAAQGAAQKAEAERAARRRQTADEGAARNRDLKSAGHQAFIGEHEYFHLPSGDLVRARREGRLDENGHRVGARDVAPAHRAAQTLRQHIADAGERGEQVSGPAAQRNAPGKGTFGERREATVKAMQDREPHGLPRYRVLGTSDDQTTCDICGKQDLKRTVALHHEVTGDVVRAGSDCAAELLKTSRGSIEKAAQQHGEKREVAIQKALESHPNQEVIKRFASQIDRITQYHRGQKTTPGATEQGKIAFARQRMAELTAEARRDIEKQLPPDKPLPEAGSLPAPKPFATPQTEQPPQEKVADSAVAHQQAQAALAAHRAAHDRNPNPWAPHLSPPVGDAKDRELHEKATRAQLAHQAAQAQQQGQAQAEQQQGQRAHEKDMRRVKAEATQQAAPLVPLKGRLAGLMSPEEQARLQAEHAARPQQALPEQPKALPPKEGTLLRDQASPSGKRRLEVPQPAPQPQAQAQAQAQPEQPAHPYEGEAHEHVAALPQAVRDTLTRAGVTVQQHQGSQAEALPGHGVSTPMAKLGPADAGYDSRTGAAHFFGGKAQRYNVHHEMGHALDDALGYQTTGKHHTPYSSQPQFQALFRKHKENMDLPPPMRTNAQEMFADAFAMHHDVLHQEGETADGEPRMVHRGRKLERAAPDLRAHIAALSEHPPGGKARESASAAHRFSTPIAAR